MSGSQRRRPFRAGGIAFSAVAASWFALTTCLEAVGCRGSGAPIGCLGTSLLAAATAVLLGLVVVAWGLAGKGLVHALLGSFACGCGGLQIGFWISAQLPFLGDDFSAILAIATVIATLTALWAWKVPALGRRKTRASGLRRWSSDRRDLS